MNEIDKFFGELPSEDKKIADVFAQETPTAPAAIDGTAISNPEEGEGRKNRRHRRLEEALKKERESNIALNARIQALAEVRNSPRDTESSNIPAEWVALYGNTPESQKAWQMQERLFDNRAAKIKEETLQEFEQQQVKVQQEQKQFESFIDSQLETLEDEFNVDLTSDAPKARKSRREFLEMVQSLSPKDDNGTITDYADFGSTFEVYQKTNLEKTDETINRKKEIASRSMQRPTNNGGEQSPTFTPGFRGWMKDYNINN